MTIDEPLYPQASDGPSIHADWLEFQVLSSAIGYMSWTEYQQFVKVGGSVEILEQEEGAAVPGRPLDDDARIEQLIDDVVAEISFRVRDCGGEGGTKYPFKASRDGLEVLGSGESVCSVYSFLLTLGWIGGKLPEGEPGERLFEDVCSYALRNYLGGKQEGVNSTVFGFPRRMLPSGFRNAVEQLCRDLGEGGGPQGAPEARDQKDAGLDIVGWRDFPDRRDSKLVVFGQCATGKNWFNKIHELRPSKWCQLWMCRSPSVVPVASLFVPLRIERKLWRRATTYGGILFDRCRIVSFANELEEGVGERVREWVRSALSEAQRL